MSSPGTVTELNEIISWYIQNADDQDILFTRKKEVNTDALERNPELFVDTEEFPTKFTREARLVDTWSLGRSLGNLKTALFFLEHTPSLVEQNPPSAEIMDASKVCWDLFNIEITLRITGISPDIAIQVKQRRRRIANQYRDKIIDEFRGADDGVVEEDEEDAEKEDSDSSEDGAYIGRSSAIISRKDAAELSNAVNDWLYILSIQFKDTHSLAIITDSRLELQNLVGDPDSFFREDVWEWLDDQPKEDFKESVKCLAFGSSTASVMLALRAVEHCLGRWYEDDTGREIENRTWGQVISELEDYYDKDDRPAMLSNLDYLKEKRNAVSHPEDSPTKREAEQMMFRMEGIITEIYEYTHTT